MNHLDWNFTHREHLAVFEGCRIYVRRVSRVEVVWYILLICESPAARNVVRVAVRVEDGDKFCVLFFEDRFVFICIQGSVEHCGLPSRYQDVGEAAFAGSGDLD